MLIPIIGSINEMMYKRICLLTEKQSFFTSEKLYLLINSSGGYVLWMNKIIEHILSFDFDTVGYVSGNAHSAAFVILQHCKERIIHPNGSLMMHYPRYTYGGILNYSNASREERIILRRHNKFLEYLSGKTEVPVKLLKYFNRTEKFFDADQGLKFGFVDEVCDMSYLIRKPKFFPRL